MAKKTVILISGATEEQLSKISGLLGDGFEIRVVDVEALKTENSALTTKILEIEKSLKEKDNLIKSQMQAIKALEDKPDLTEELNAKIDGLTVQVKEKDALILELMESQKSVEAEREIGKPIVECNGVSYEVKVTKFNFRGKEITMQKLREDKALVKELVKIGSGVLKKLD